MFRSDGQAVALREMGIECIAIDENGDVCADDGSGRF